MRQFCLLVLSSCCFSVTTTAFVVPRTTFSKVFATKQPHTPSLYRPSSALSIAERSIVPEKNDNGSENLNLSKGVVNTGDQLQDEVSDFYSSSSYYSTTSTTNGSGTTEVIGSSSSSKPKKMTPCVRICRYNADFYGGAVCIGCFREAFEIGFWSSFTDQERLYAYQDALDRCQSARLNGFSFPGSVLQAELELQKNRLEQTVNSHSTY